ncbi:chromosome partitioning protein ParB [Clostridium polyendosporum]|uniref:Chromosome partitioning protein ParB n=1 Tax=Clostridium polyendosporum TaxID=69208 RepID=A0A919S1P0_9CLOT|nr:ParB/RepB/Spo0J family partition protein [Clostridium polyendosporum]GIM28973.1 chromosome partitioning protein ParB [Clostridium polyendosporum]
MSKKFGLGKGLGALIPEDNLLEEENKKEQKVLIPLNKIKTNENQPRKYFDNEKIAELSESIKQHGIIQPLILKKEDDVYMIIAGERRWRAAKQIGLKEVPAIIMDINDRELLEISLIENIQREDLNPIEEAIAYQRLLNDFQLTQGELSERIGKSRTTITNTMRLLNLDERVQNYIIEGILSEGHGRAILGLQDNSKQYEISQKVIDEGLSVRETEKFIKIINENKEEKKIKENNNQLDRYYNDIKDKLQGHLGTKVNISDRNNRGKIEIEYYSQEDLQRILDIMNI